MKPTIVLCLLLFAIPMQSEEVKWYAFGGTSLFREDTDTLIGDGLGLRAGVGSQFNSTFGIEVSWNGAPAVENSSLAAAIAEDQNLLLRSYAIETQPNFYFSLAGTLTLPMDDQLSFIGKVGYARYSVESQIEIDFAQDEFFYYYYYAGSGDIRHKESGNDAILSLGLLFHVQEKSAIELSMTNVFGDWGALTFNGTLRYTF
ncbi:MAG: hypothetical protein F4Z01_08175 [Gammaproteobacteria bacterium]|nr:hypothetical protein [Gammaproteobacteria bacterium]MYF37172.1 hypothetical protein [Gammaproteobacteria bacterium]